MESRDEPVAAGLRSVLRVLVGIVGLTLTAVGVWWALAHTGVARIVGTALPGGRGFVSRRPAGPV